MSFNRKPMNKNKIFITLLIAVVTIGVTFFFGTQKNIIPTAPQVTDTTENWKTYEFQEGLFKYPSAWSENPIQISGSGSTREIKDKEGQYAFTFSIRGNYSQLTGKPFATLEESLGSPSKTLPSLAVDGQEGKQIFPFAGSENKNGVVFFTKDLKSIYSLVLETSAKNGAELFSQIVSTFTFTPGSDSQNYISAMSILQGIPEIQDLQKDIIKLGRTTFFKAGDEHGDIVKIWLYEDGFPDNHITRIDTFNVNIKTSVITVDDVAMMSGKEFITLEEWKKDVKGRFQ